LSSAAATSDDCRELGFLVEDHYQRLGIGSAMLGALMKLIGPEEDLRVSALFENQWLLGKLSGFGTVVTHLDSGIIDARVIRGSR
jgi:GNAT superfamily N-acetyltransferase